MCRHLAWLGQPRTLAALVLDPPHGLLTQSYAPRRQRHGRMNADGWGVGFYACGRRDPARWRSTRPLWGDASFASVAPVVSSRCVLAAVRSATVGMPIEEGATAPFASGRWLLSHNGVIDRGVLPALGGTAPATAESVCDSALLAAHLFAGRVERLGAAVVELAGHDAVARLNVLATDGDRILATTWGDTLSVLVDPTGVAVASEPYDDDPRWAEIPDRHLLEVTPDGIAVTALETLA